MKIDRRNFCRLGVAGAGVATLPSCSAKHVPLIKSVLTTSTENQGLLTIAKSIEQEHNYEAKVEGKLPADLRGTLFRNGPGLFDRAGLRKNFIVDGDGMIRKYSFHDKGVRFENRFIQTQKYKDEAMQKHDIEPCFWFRGLLPASAVEVDRQHKQIVVEFASPWLEGYVNNGK